MTEDPYPPSERSGTSAWDQNLQQPGAAGSGDANPYAAPGGPAPALPGYPAPYGAGLQPGAYPGYYAGAYPPGAHPRPDEMNWAGITSLALAPGSLVISLLLPPLGLIALVVSIVLGIIGLSAAREGKATNRGIALAGLITSVVLLALGILAVIATIVFFGVFISEVSQTSY